MIEKFEPGMHLRIREYDDMKNDPSFRRARSCIVSPCGIIFFPTMKCFCGMEIHVENDYITESDSHGSLYVVSRENGERDLLDTSMVDLVENIKTEFDCSDITSFVESVAVG